MLHKILKKNEWNENEVLGSITSWQTSCLWKKSRKKGIKNQTPSSLSWFLLFYIPSFDFIKNRTEFQSETRSVWNSEEKCNHVCHGLGRHLFAIVSFPPWNPLVTLMSFTNSWLDTRNNSNWMTKRSIQSLFPRFLMLLFLVFLSSSSIFYPWNPFERILHVLPPPLFHLLFQYFYTQLNFLL